MNFILFRGIAFKETFDFKNEDGKSIAMPSAQYRLVLERGTWAREYTQGAGLTKSRTQLVWTINAEDTNNFEYNTLYYTLYMNDTELARGVVKVQ